MIGPSEYGSMTTLIFLIGAILLIGNGDTVRAIYKGELQDRRHAGMSHVERVNALRQYMQDEVQVNPGLYYFEDLTKFLQDVDGSFASKFLNQRSNNVDRAFKLAWQTLRWRHKMGLLQWTGEHFPCDLFELGLVFESGVAHHKGPNGEYIQGNPVIWIRLGALGGIVEQRSLKIPAKQMWSTARNKIMSAGFKTRISSHRSYHESYSTGTPNQQAAPYGGSGSPRADSMSVKDDKTMMHILRAIAWWLEDWRLRHEPNAKATLVLDFENTDFAFSSWTVSGFFMSLDDYFPDMFDQIIGFRFKPRMWSLHSAISMFNRIFKSRFSSSPETDRKLRFVQSELQISNYMPRVDVKGFTKLPDHVSGNCLAPIHKPPTGCQHDLNPLAAAGLIDPEMWSSVRNEFYNICRPMQRPL